MFDYFEVNTSWKTTDTRVFLPIFLTLVFFVLYWFTAQSDKIKTSFFAKNTPDQGSVKHVFFTKYFGFLSMGVAPIVLCLIFIPEISLSQYGLTFIRETSLFTAVWTLGLSFLVVPLAYFSAKKPKNLLNYPQIRAKVWTKKTLFINLLGWALYLFGYEFLFRGVLLIPLVEPLGVWVAITINIALYSATHIPKGLDETLGAIPLGLVLCLLTLASGTIWIAFLVHLAMAWTNSLTALKHNTETHLKTD
jgi:membrane protease YdiL (CAAX protease family)